MRRSLAHLALLWRIPEPLRGAYEVARTELYKALEVLDAQAITYRLAPKEHARNYG